MASRGAAHLAAERRLVAEVREAAQTLARVILRRPAPGGSVRDGPVYFVYDSYHIPAADWAEVLGLAGEVSVALEGMGRTAHMQDTRMEGGWRKASGGQMVM